MASRYYRVAMANENIYRGFFIIRVSVGTGEDYFISIHVSHGRLYTLCGCGKKIGAYAGYSAGDDSRIFLTRYRDIAYNEQTGNNNVAGTDNDIDFLFR